MLKLHLIDTLSVCYTANIATNSVSRRYRAAYLRDPTFSCFDTIQECDRQTDRHTTTAYTVLSIASCGKNVLRDVTTPLQGRFVVRRLGLATVNLYTKYEFSMFTP